MDGTSENSFSFEAGMPTDHIIGNGKFHKYADEIAQFIKQSFETPGFGPVVGIFGPWGSGKTSLFHLAARQLPNWQDMEFHPTHYDTEGEVAAAFFEAALRHIQVEAKGTERIKVKWQIWRHGLKLKGGFIDLGRQLLNLGLRLIMYVVLPAVIFRIPLPESWEGIGTTIVAALGGALLIQERAKEALKPGLNLNEISFTKRVGEASATSSIDTYVREFKWIANLARSMQNPLIVMVDPIDAGLPFQTTLIIETLRLFGTGRVPCAFVIFSDDIETLQTVIRVRFLSQQGNTSDEALQEHLLKMADKYFRSVVDPFELEVPSAEEMDKYWQERLENSSGEI
jgi:hypothetical protein